MDTQKNENRKQRRERAINCFVFEGAAISVRVYQHVNKATTLPWTPSRRLRHWFASETKRGVANRERVARGGRSSDTLHRRAVQRKRERERKLSEMLTQHLLPLHSRYILFCSISFSLFPPSFCCGCGEHHVLLSVVFRLCVIQSGGPLKT